MVCWGEFGVVEVKRIWMWVVELGMCVCKDVGCWMLAAWGGE